MEITKEELVSILASFNPWWKDERIPDLPVWHRGAFQPLMTWIECPPAQRAVLLSGPRQVGKTTLLLQAIQKLLSSGVPAGNILYATFDHPICKLAGLDAVLKAWRELIPKMPGPEFLFLDEAQFIANIGTWIKHHVDFFKTKRIIFSGSATPLIAIGQESGVGRWHTLHVSTLSFYEYLLIRNTQLPSIPTIGSLKALDDTTLHERQRIVEAAASLIGHFHEYLIRGGFPQTVLVDSLTQAQKLLREDIIEKVLKRDMTALFGVRRVLELEQMFIFLCLHDGELQGTKTIAKELGIARQTVQSFIDLFESTHLIYKLPPFGYGKEILRGKNKIYLSDPAIAPAVLLKGKTLLENPSALGQCVETAIICHLWSHCQDNAARFSYWRSPKDKEVDLIVEVDGVVAPFEVKYQSQSLQKRQVPGLIERMQQKAAMRFGYVVTKSPEDFGLFDPKNTELKIVKIPACLLCYWLGASSFSQKNLLV